jgi:NADPH-dependent 2,4-dienoyl-CoA reductase/sulfur reductase-like enzyme
MWIVGGEIMSSERGCGPGDLGGDSGLARVDTVVIGAGQAGLAAGYYLARRGGGSS